MKKTKLLTSLAALALVVSLGACDLTSDDSTDEESETSESSESTESTESSETSEDETTSDTTSGGTESTGPVADMLADIAENSNFTLTIEYYDWYSGYYEDETAMLQDYYGGNMSVTGQDLFIDITATEDAFLLEYYISYSEWLAGTTYDIELYVNTDAGFDIYYISEPYDTELYYVETVEGFTWQDYFWSPIYLEDYSSRFIEGETTTGKYGNQTSYTINLDFSFLNTLVNCLFSSGNYFDYYSYFIYYYTTYYYYYGALPTTTSTFYVDDGEWDVAAYYFFEWSYEDSNSSSGKTYWLEFDSVYTYLYEVGTSEISEAYASYLN